MRYRETPNELFGVLSINGHFSNPRIIHPNSFIFETAQEAIARLPEINPLDIHSMLGYDLYQFYQSTPNYSFFSSFS